MGGEVSYAVAFGTGLLSFFTPCILPLLPVYFGYLAGEALGKVKSGKIHKKLMLNALAFVLGLSFLNLLLGFGAKALAGLLLTYSQYLRWFGGGLLIFFGLYFILGKSLGFMEKEHRHHYTKYQPNFIKSFALGVTFSFGWTPCNGPIVTMILMMASFQKDYMAAGTLMLVYSAGFAVMFLVSALLVGVMVDKIKGIYPYFGKIKVVSGVIMIIMGLLMIADKLYWLSV